MTMNRRQAILATLAAGIAAGASAQLPPPAGPASRPLVWPDPTETVELWPDGAPGPPSPLPVEAVRERSADPAFNDRYVVGIARPRMAVFRPDRPNGAAALIIPGGTYQRVVIDKEGYELARRLAAEGVTAFVLFYRLPGEGWAAGPDLPLADAQRAVRRIRERAADFGLDPARVLAIGFSAGGHACADLVARFDLRVQDPVDAADRLFARPDAAALVYPVVSMSAPLANAGTREQLVGAAASPERERAHSPHLHVRPDSPPCFLVHAEDDDAVPVGNSLAMRDALRAHGVPVETHLFADGGHGFGLRLARGKSVEPWPDLLVAWARYRGLWS